MQKIILRGCIHNFSLILLVAFISCFAQTDVKPFNLSDSWTHNEVEFFKYTVGAVKRCSYWEYKLGYPGHLHVGSQYPAKFWAENSGKSIISRKYIHPIVEDGSLVSYDECEVNLTVITDTSIFFFHYNENDSIDSVDYEVKINSSGEPISWYRFNDSVLEGKHGYFNHFENGLHEAGYTNISYANNSIKVVNWYSDGNNLEFDPIEGVYLSFENDQMVTKDSFEYSYMADYYELPNNRVLYNRDEKGFVISKVSSCYKEGKENKETGKFNMILKNYDSTGYAYADGARIGEVNFRATVDSLGIISELNKRYEKEWNYITNTDKKKTYIYSYIDTEKNSVLIEDTISYVYSDNGNIREFHKNGMVRKIYYEDKFPHKVEEYFNGTLRILYTISLEKSTTSVLTSSKTTFANQFQILNNTLWLESNENIPTNVTIYSLHGRMIGTVSLEKNGAKYTCDLSNFKLSKGLYIATVNIGGSNISKKFVY